MYMSVLQSEQEYNLFSDLRQLFMCIDTNKDGLLSVQELQNAISNVLDNISTDTMR